MAKSAIITLADSPGSPSFAKGAEIFIKSAKIGGFTTTCDVTVS